MTKELSIFVDESGDRNGKARYYLLTLVFHDQSKEIMSEIKEYEKRLAIENLPNIPFHSEPLMNGHKDYKYLTISQRKKMFVHFSALVRRLPISYTTFIYRRNETGDPIKLTARMKQDISSLFLTN